MAAYTPQDKDSFNYGDNMNTSYTGYLNKNYVIKFENARIPTSEQDVVEFKAFITAFKDLFKPEWNEETVFGRTEPIGIYKGISRRLSFGFDAPADSVIEGKDNLSKTEDLVKMLYPTYHQPGDDPNYRILSQAPLIRLSFVNIINDHKNNRGLLGYITSFDYDLNFGKDIGVFDGEKDFLAPRVISFNIDFTVLHEIPLGYDTDNTFASKKGWLYGVKEEEIATATKRANRTRAEAEKAKRDAEEAKDASDAEAERLATWDEDSFDSPKPTTVEEATSRTRSLAPRYVDPSVGSSEERAIRARAREYASTNSSTERTREDLYAEGLVVARKETAARRYDQIAERGAGPSSFDSSLPGVPGRRGY